MISYFRLFTYIVFFSLTVEAKFDLFMTKKLNMPENYKETSVVTTVSDKAASSISSTDSEKTVITKIVDSSIMYWWDNSGIKNTSIGQAVETVQNKVRADVNLGSTGSDNSHNQTKHKLSIRLLAAQALAKIEYFGWFKAAFKYDAKTATSEAEVFENLANNKDLIISHSVTAIENKSQVSLRWSW